MSSQYEVAFEDLQDPKVIASSNNICRETFTAKMDRVRNQLSSARIRFAVTDHGAMFGFAVEYRDLRMVRQLDLELPGYCDHKTDDGKYDAVLAEYETFNCHMCGQSFEMTSVGLKKEDFVPTVPAA